MRRKAGEKPRESKGSAGGGAVAERGRGERRDTEEEATRERTTRVGRPRGGMKVAGESTRDPAKGDRKRQTTKG